MTIAVDIKLTQGHCCKNHPCQGHTTQGSCNGKHHVRCRKSLQCSKDRTGHKGHLNYRPTSKPVE